MSNRKLIAVLFPGSAFTFGIGLEVSGVQSAELTVLLWAASFALFVAGISSWLFGVCKAIRRLPRPSPVVHINKLIIIADSLVNDIFEHGKVTADSTKQIALWRQNAERLIECHGNGSKLTDFRTASENDQGFGGHRMLSGDAWILVRKVNAQSRVLHRWRDSLMG